MNHVVQSYYQINDSNCDVVTKVSPSILATVSQVMMNVVSDNNILENK